MERAIHISSINREKTGENNLKLEMEMNIQEFITNQQKMHREFFKM